MMAVSPRRFRCGLVLTAAVAAVAAVATMAAAPAVRTAPEVRALWVVRTTLTSRESIAAMVSAARASGFNTLLVQVRGRGDAYYAGGLEPRAPQLATAPTFDPLATTLALAHAAGLQVHAWINIGLIAGAAELPAARDHVIYRHPEWLMVPRGLASALAGTDPRSPEYLGRLARYVRSQPAELEGLYLSPVTAAAADYTVAVVSDIVDRYAVDGVHFDYVRFPTDDFDFSRGALAAFRSEVTGLSAAERHRLDARLPDEPLAYAQALPDRWHAFRRDRLTSLVVRLHDTVKSRGASAVVSAAVGPDPAESAARRLQDWRTWVDRGLLDAVCPMAYTTDGRLFAAQIAAAQQIAGRRQVWAGIGAYRLSTDEIVRAVDSARRVGAGGVALFSYDSLINPSRADDLAQVGRAAFNAQF